MKTEAVLSDPSSPSGAPKARATHIPAPWKIRRGFRGGYEIYAPDKGIKRPFQPTEVATVDDSHDNWRENARHIVQCVNAHDDMLTALEAVYTKFGDFRHEWQGRTSSEGQWLLTQMRDAISKATGRDSREVQDDYGTRVARAEHERAAEAKKQDQQ